MLRDRIQAAFITLALSLGYIACSHPEPEQSLPGPVVVVGIDGASWSAIEELWSAGRLPHLHKLAEGGIASQLIPVADASPVIWTSMATGVVPERHGITNFVVNTEMGDIPVSSTVRRVPAVWTMASAAHRRVAILGWWASWPAEEVSGVVVSDRPLGDVDNAFYPAEFSNEFQMIVEQEVDSSPAPEGETRIGRQDRAIAAVARRLVSSDFDLLMVYQRNVDAESHRYWKYFRPQSFESVDRDEVERLGDRIPRAYDAVDRLVGELVAQADPNTTFFVVSDHGFYPLKRPRRRISIDLDQLLEGMGYLSRTEHATDWSRTRAIAWDSPPDMRIKMVRLARNDRKPAGAVQPGDIEQTYADLFEDLTNLLYGSGKPVFRVRAPRNGELARGGDITAVVQSDGATTEIIFNGKVIPAKVRIGQEISGSHSKATEGIFLAAGPIIEKAFQLESIHSLDITPTLLAAMGLPVARDFDGTAQLGLFQRSFLDRHPPQSISTWGASEQGTPVASEVDESLIEELKALGYLE